MRDSSLWCSSWTDWLQGAAGLGDKGAGWWGRTYPGAWIPLILLSSFSRQSSTSPASVIRSGRAEGAKVVLAVMEPTPEDSAEMEDVAAFTVGDVIRIFEIFAVTAPAGAAAPGTPTAEAGAGGLCLFLLLLATDTWAAPLSPPPCGPVLGDAEELFRLLLSWSPILWRSLLS